jgi:predicted tellurium resistance membrane protein TerC
LGGLPLMLIFVAILFKAFQLLGRRMQTIRMTRDPTEFMLWCIGASLFAHAFTFMAVSYYDQSYVFFCLLIGAVPGLCAAPVKHQECVELPTPDIGMFSVEQQGGRDTGS